ncbi:trypsin iota-like [Drosophila montana]|uniref:trypsin iota-like n=1 Tax=Drosophila montana TaxID=40370 RepID=UPI00313B9AD0
MSSNTGDNLGGWLVRVRSGGADTLSCGGSYYGPILVISSANCIHPFRYQLDDASVVTTANAEDEDYSFALVDTVYSPEEFVEYRTNMDIALVRLDTPLKGTMTEFIRLTNTWATSATVFSTFGWGFDSLDVQPATDEPRMVENSMFVGLATCKKRFQAGFVADTIMCATLPRDMFDCIYDGGSPLVAQNELFGIASVGSTCRNTSNPGIYTNLMLLKPFINKIERGIRSGQLERRKREIRPQWESLKRSPSP